MPGKSPFSRKTLHSKVIDMKELNDITSALSAGKIDGETALRLLSELHEKYPGDDEILTERGMLHWGRGEWSACSEDYLAAIRINPDSRAKVALKMANSNMDFYNKDLFNP